MLSIKECRKLLDGDERYSDEQIEKIRDDIHSLVEIILDDYIEKVMSGKINAKQEQ